MAEHDRRSTQALRGGLSSSRMIAQLRDGAARARRERFARRLVRWARLVRPAARHPPTPLIESRWSQFASEYQRL
jgi:hypothetical protein